MADVWIEPLPPEKALQYWKAKVPLTKKSFDLLAAEEKAMAFTAAGLATLKEVTALQDAMTKAIAGDVPWSKFKADTMKLLGDERYGAHHLATVYHTNIQTAYGAGRYEAQWRNRERMPYWQYDAVNDSRTRPAHRYMDGRVFPANHPVWHIWYPPNGYRCRCKVIALSARMVERQGLRIETEDPTGSVLPGGTRTLRPDPGFDINAGRVAWQPQLEGVRADLREAFLRRLASICGSKFSASTKLCPLLRRRLTENDLSALESMMEADRLKAQVAWTDWVKTIRNTMQPRGEIYPVGMIPADVLAQLKVQPVMAMLLMDDKAIAHLSRDAKAKRQRIISLEEIQEAPEMIKQAAWFLDTKDHALLIAWPRRGEEWVKLVVRMDRRIGKGVGNQVVTAGVVRGRNLLDKRYRKLK
ncbi:MAG: minor capsid protein [Magnetococcales bacterium]|nr:minor capsid protein [Magnetococcales bacterium]